MTLARRCFADALAALDPRPRVRAALQREPAEAGEHAVLAVGKAAGPMLAGWLEAAPPAVVAIVLVRPAGTPSLPLAWSDKRRFHVREIIAGHPQPDAASLEAGRVALDLAHWCACEPDRRVLTALVSGGGSALMESPLEGGQMANLDELSRRNQLLVVSGAGIGDINCIRKHLSAVKGGRVAAAATGARQSSWILSDVPPGGWADVASGPTCPDASTQADFETIWRRWLPGEPPRHPETPKLGDAAFARAQWRCLADNHDACEAMAMAARAAGLGPLVVDHAADEWEEDAAAEYLLAQWRQLRRGHPRAALIAGGEVRVRLRPDHGRGGRNTNLALRVAMALAGGDDCFLSAGTDGVDGSSDAAGAVVDGQTAARVRAAGLDPAEYLCRQDAHPALEAAGALLRTGPTGNNLRDVRMFC